jgi:hypothetical protein
MKRDRSHVNVIGEFQANRHRFFEIAAAATGLDDFGADDYSEGLDLFLECLDRECNLAPMGRSKTIDQIVATLSSRLYSEAGWKQHPKTLRAKLETPMIVTGIVRSGTTALHRLMSVDPQFQGLEHWLARAPQPRPARHQWIQIPAYRKAVNLADDMMGGAPEMKTDHMMSADEVEESLILLIQSFTNNMFPSMWNIPSYDAWFQRQDETASYARLLRNFQLIGMNDLHRRWLMKNPSDLLSLNAVLNVFPDAMIIQTHRDPIQSIPSITNVIFALHRMFEPQTDAEFVGRREADFWTSALKRAYAARHRTRGPIFDMEFNEFIRDPLGTVRQIYDHFGLVLTAPVEADMRQWLVDHPRNSTSLQRFRPEDFGIATNALHEQFAFYRELRGYTT